MGATRAPRPDRPRGEPSADQIDADLSDTDRFAARQEADCQAAFYRVLGGLLSGAIGDLTPAQRDRLRARAKEVLRLKEEEQAESAAERKRTQATNRDAQATVEAGERQAQPLRTRRDLRDDRPVPPEDLDAAIATYTELGATSKPTSDDSGGRRRGRR